MGAAGESVALQLSGIVHCITRFFSQCHAKGFIYRDVKLGVILPYRVCDYVFAGYAFLCTRSNSCGSICSDVSDNYLYSTKKVSPPPHSHTHTYTPPAFAVFW